MKRQRQPRQTSPTDLGGSHRPAESADGDGSSLAAATPGPQRVAWVDMARGLSVVAIVALHSSLWFAAPLLGNDGSTGARVWEVANNRLGTVRLPLLFLLSGWLAAGRIRRDDGARKTLAAVATNAWLYVVWLTIYLLVALVVDPIEIVAQPESPADVVLRYLVPSVTPLWFVWALALYNGGLRLVRRVPPPVVLGALLAARWAVDLTFGEEREPMWLRAIRLSLYFAVGVYGRDVLRGLVERRRTGWVALAVIAVSIVGDALAPAALHHPFTVTLSLAVAVLALCVMRLGSRLRALRGPLQWIGTRTVGVYVLHPVLIVGFTALCRPVQDVVVGAFGSTPGRLVMPLLVTALVVSLALAAQSLLRRVGGHDLLLDLPRPWRARLLGAGHPRA